LLRQPNTPHPGVEYTDDVKYCVPVSIEELADMDVEKYKELTDKPRSPPPACQRNESEEAGYKVEQAIRGAKGATVSNGSLSASSSYDSSKIQAYQEQSNDRIDVEDIKLLTTDKPFIWKFRQRDDAYQYGEQSRVMEMFIMLDLTIDRKVPIEVIVDFFRPIPGFDEEYTREMVKDLIARDYKRMAFSTLENRAPEF
jgi:hypothetical protein